MIGKNLIDSKKGRAKKFLKLWMKAKEGDQKAKEDLKKHDAEEREFKRRANETGYFWA
ncbi:hypothetical protein BN1013_00704 [Candidatus Rubidus massiliensis]|nr:hypothetical protein BN1013_00704 [Candidatus Rubidus massiliensis]